MEISLTATRDRRTWHDVRVLYFQLLAVVAVFAAIAWLATGRGGEVGETHPDRPDVALPDDRQLRKDDVDAARFTVGWRGYRMDEVDMVLDRLAAEIEYRDRLIAELMPQGGAAVAQPAPGSSLDYDFRPGSQALADVVPTMPVGTLGAAGTIPATEQVDLGSSAPTRPVEFGLAQSQAPAATPIAPSAPNPFGTDAAQTARSESAETAPAVTDEGPDEGNPLSAWYRKPE
jgi:DivIVA domain-containing protein